VQHADPAVLAEVLAQHFKGEAEILAVTAGATGSLLVRGSPEAVEEVARLIRQLDHEPRAVEVEIVFAEVSPLKAADGKEAEETDISGPDPLAKLDALIKAGKAAGAHRIKLTAVEGQPVTSTTGGDKPYVSGAAVVGGPGGFGGGGRGGAPGGAGAGGGGVVALDLNLQDSRVRNPEPTEEGGPGGVGAAAFETGSLTTRLSVPSGKSVLAQAVRTEGKGTATVSLVVVGARVVGPEAAGGR
jgi:hypothetical protein